MATAHSFLSARHGTTILLSVLAMMSTCRGAEDYSACSTSPLVNVNTNNCIHAAYKLIQQQSSCDGKTWVPDRYAKAAAARVGDCCISMYHGVGSGVAHSSDYLQDRIINGIVKCAPGYTHLTSSATITYNHESCKTLGLGGDSFAPPPSSNSSQGAVPDEQSTDVVPRPDVYLDGTIYENGTTINNSSALVARGAINQCKRQTTNIFYEVALCVLAESDTGVGKPIAGTPTYDDLTALSGAAWSHIYRNPGLDVAYFDRSLRGHGLSLDVSLLDAGSWGYAVQAMGVTPFQLHMLLNAAMSHGILMGVRSVRMMVTTQLGQQLMSIAMTRG
ncbi:hypothetical protein K491DRAFT_755290 [Lophiostoma macrostomum CBS 122681]|uniref:Uncharacterized protein n=1 Tax=Lophiostoma macrostomum CBS 122681 TaxID=1314788 RepID=A0A6A6TJY5_9PLEO|nr:hypothetical protein K491DRAFT_755290 [Lophiostoma macrostomum CBS 122681]